MIVLSAFGFAYVIPAGVLGNQNRVQQLFVFHHLQKPQVLIDRLRAHAVKRHPASTLCSFNMVRSDSFHFVHESKFLLQVQRHDVPKF